MFVVQHKDGQQKLAPNAINAILIAKGARISSDAVIMAIDHEIEILFVDSSGFPRGRVWSNQYGSISTIRKMQVHFASSPDGFSWAKQLVQQKVRRQMALLKKIGPTEKVATTIAYLKKQEQAMQTMPVHDAAKSKMHLRGLEGSASKAYFACVSKCLPPKFQFTKRSRRPAQDMFNALLNYAYGMLYGKIEGALIIAGIDPYLGVFHSDMHNRPVLVFDMIEPYRPWADEVVIELCKSHTVDQDLFSTHAKGYWLEKTGRSIIIEQFNAFLEEVVDLQKRRRSRKTHISLACTDLATSLQKFTP